MNSAPRGNPALPSVNLGRIYGITLLGVALFIVVFGAMLASVLTANRDGASRLVEGSLQAGRASRVADAATRVALRTDEPRFRSELSFAARDFRTHVAEATGDAALARESARYADLADRIASDARPARASFAELLRAHARIREALEREYTARGRRSEAELDRIVLLVAAPTLIAVLLVALAWRFVVRPFARRERSNSERLRGLFENNPVAVATYSRSGKITAANAAAVTLLGDDEWTLLGSHFSKHIAPEDLAAAGRAFARTLAGEPTEFETTFLRVDGERRRVLANVFPSTIDGKVVGVYAIGRDITTLTQTRVALGESEQRFRALFEQNPDCVAIIDTDGRYVAVNAAAAALIGESPEAFVGKAIGSVGRAKPEALHLPHASMRRLYGGESVEYRMQVVDRSGRPIDLAGRAVPISYDGRIHGFFSIARDVTLDLRTREEIVENARRLHDLYLVAAASGRSSEEQIASALELGRTHLGFDCGYYVRVDDGFATVRHVVGSGTESVGASFALSRTMMRHAIAAGELQTIDDAECEPWHSDPGRESRGLRSYVSIPIAIDGVVEGALGFAGRAPRTTPLTQSERDFVRLIAALVESAVERERQREKLDALAFFDSLTGLSNRALLENRTRDLVEAARARNERFALLFIDLDNFKSVNDAFGHAVGDDVLRIVARRLQSAVDPGATVARLGGDEFVVLAPLARSVADANDLARKLIAALSEPVVASARTHDLAGSIGVALYPDDGSDYQTLIDGADRALYRAKQAGGNRFDACDPVGTR